MTWADDYEFGEEFEQLSPDAEALWSAELDRELAPGHPLHGKSWRVVAKYVPQDEIVLIADSAVYQVHLTFSGCPERPGFPSWNLFPTAAEFELANKYR